MFGYVRTYPPDLRLREWDLYRATYCGLCHAMGKCTGNCSRFALSYDFAFLALFRTLLSGEKPTPEKRACLPHPFKKHPTMPLTPAMRETVGAEVLLTCAKLSDDLADEKGKKRFLARLALPYYRRKKKKLLRRNPLWQKEDEAIEAILSDFRAKEKAAKAYLSDPVGNPPVYADELTSLSGKLLSVIFAGEAEETVEDGKARIASAIGDALGRYIYLADALDDFDEDVKKGRFNPLRLLYGDTLTEDDRASVAEAVRLHLSGAVPAIDLIDGTDDADRKAILENVFYRGLTVPLDTAVKGGKVRRKRKEEAPTPQKTD